MIGTLNGSRNDLLASDSVGATIVSPQWNVLDATLNSTLAGAYVDESESEQADAESRDWGELARRSLARWAKENPY